MSTYTARVSLEMEIDVEADSEEEAREKTENIIYRYFEPHTEYIDTPEIDITLIKEDAPND